MKQKLIFIDLTSDLDHNLIKTKPVGASEYQFYNLILKLSFWYDIVCFNNKQNTFLINGIFYENINKLLLFEIDDIKIIVLRFLPNHNKQIYNHIKNNKIYLWIHDLVDKENFIYNLDFDEKKICYSDEKYFEFNVLYDIFFQNKNISFVFVSNFIKDKFKNYFLDYQFNLEENRMNVIYNILYPEQFDIIKNINTNVEVEVKVEVDVDFNMITFASAWIKGIKPIIELFDLIIKKDPNIKLCLMTPGYDWNIYKEYAEHLKNVYKDKIIIHGPLNKEKYAIIIKKSLLVLSTTFQETFGCVFAEAYYLGTPVIADYRSGAVKEIIDNDYIVNYDDKNETINKIMFIKNNRENLKIELEDKFKEKPNIDLWKCMLKYV